MNYQYQYQYADSDIGDDLINELYRYGIHYTIYLIEQFPYQMASQNIHREFEQMLEYQKKYSLERLYVETSQ